MIKIIDNSEYRLSWFVFVFISSFLFLLIPIVVHSSDMDSELLLAAKENNLPLMKASLEKGANVNTKDDFDRTPLIFAANLGHADCVKILLENGAEVNCQCFRKCSPLMWSAINGHTQVVRMLIEKGADPNIQDFDGWTALMKAVYNGNVEIVQILINNGADLNLKNIGKHTALYIAEKLNTWEEIIAMGDGPQKLDNVVSSESA
jgi:ankyrin repeat protein